MAWHGIVWYSMVVCGRVWYDLFVFVFSPSDANVACATMKRSTLNQTNVNTQAMAYLISNEFKADNDFACVKA